MSERNRFWRLVERPRGNDFASALALEEGDLPQPGPLELRVRNRILSMDAGTRMWMNPREDSFQPPTPLGAPVEGTIVGEVVVSNHPDFAVGTFVRGYGQWADYSLVRPQAVRAAPVDPTEDLAEYVGILGANGWTAYVGVFETGAVRAGETFVVSSAAGCTGMLAGQVARIAGCRVVGIAGGPEKCRYVCEELGFDAALDYKAGGLTEALRETCPEGVNVYFDNVAGDVLDAVLANMALFGRVAVCGLIGNYSAEGPVPGPYQFDQVLMKRLRIEGFFSPDFYHREPEFNPYLKRWRDAGRLRLPVDETAGLEHTVTAYTKLFEGTNIGKVVVRL